MADPIRTTGNNDSGTKNYLGFGYQVGVRDTRTTHVLTVGPKAEGAFQRDGWHGKVGLGVGTAATADLEVGHEFDFYRNCLGLDLSAYASHATSLLGEEEHTIVHSYTEGSEEHIFTDDKSYRPNITEAGLKAMFNIKPSDRVKIGLGLSGGYVKQNGLTHSYTSNYKGYSLSTEYKSDGGHFTISPEVALEIKAGKRCLIGANADCYGANLTTTVNF